MPHNDIVVVGLPSSGLRQLTSAFGLPHLEDAEILRAHDNLHVTDDATPEWMVGMLAEHFHENDSRNCLIVYQTPWTFLERRLIESPILPVRDEELEAFAKYTLRFWHAYHTALFGLHRKGRARHPMINGNRPIQLKTVGALLEDRFGIQTGSNRSLSTGHVHDDLRGGDEEAFQKIVDTLAPECLELYSGLESCAELMGRQPEFELGSDPSEKKARLFANLPLATCQGRIHHLLGQRALDLRDIEQQLETILLEQKKTAGTRPDLIEEFRIFLGKLGSMQEEAAIYLLQIQQLQEELENRIAGRM